MLPWDKWLYEIVFKINLLENNQEVMSVQSEYTAVIKQEDDWWLGWIEEIPGVNCPERTYDELKETLEVTLREALEFNRQDALSGGERL